MSDYCRGLFVELPSRKSVKKAILSGRIRLNDQEGATGDWVQQGDTILLLAPEPKTTKVYEMPLEVVLETEDFAIVNKPGGLPVSGPQFRTLVHVLPHNLQPSGKKDALVQPYPLHRLDSPTTGLVLVAKSAAAHLQLGRLFAERQITKTYQAIVIGKTVENGYFDQPVGGQSALSRFERIDLVPSIKNEYLSRMRLFPETGRTHQLRIHLAQAGHPIMGDRQYGESGKIYKGQGLFLCATGLQFTNPFSGKPVDIRIEPPAKFGKLLQREAKMWERKQRG
ncbi:MAG TPA: RluA family pseudouridine synthase [Saprospiraceae bacterium]|nr:RluA family pseudouridine synthase [Saprospiraceae bacterium]